MQASVTSLSPTLEDAVNDHVLAAQQGDSSAFEHLYRRHAPGLMPMLWRLSGGDRTLAEDWLQDSFVLAWKKLAQLREPHAFAGWLRKLAINCALSEKRRGRLESISEYTEASAPEPPWPAADLDLERAITDLPKRAREVLVLFQLEGWTHEEIAKYLKVEPGTNKSQLNRARTLLKEKLK
ncbi:MAG: sigma-70 family RNA polymerase sigma factor [Pseudomonadota bacterium]